MTSSLQGIVSESRASAVGALLYNQRQKKNESLDEVAKHLRIRANHLEALEKGDFFSLPGLAYASGFLRAYAEYLNLDGTTLVSQFRDEIAAAARKVELRPHVPDPELHTPTKPIILGAIGIFIAIYAAWYILSERAPIQDNSSPFLAEGSSEQSLATASTVVDAPLLSPESENVPPAVPVDAGQEVRLIITAVADTWMEIRDAQQQKIFSGVLLAGQTFDVTQDGLTLLTGNAGGIILSIKGKNLALLGPRGKVVRNIQLDATALQERLGFAP